MPDTTNRPTPERIADDCAVIAANLRSEGSFFATSRAERLEHLAKMLRGGAVVVRPDDVPEYATNDDFIRDRRQVAAVVRCVSGFGLSLPNDIRIPKGSAVLRIPFNA